VPEDLLSRIQRELADRMRQLEASIHEYEELRVAVDAFAATSARVSGRLTGVRGERRRAAPSGPSAGARGARTTAARRVRTTKGAAAAPGTAARGRPARARAGRAGAARSAPAGAPTARGRGTAPGGARGGRQRRAPRGANRAAMLEAVRSHPQGAVVSELARRAGVGRVSAYQVLGGLEREGLVRKRERAGGPALYVAG
jgi:hypothetical protein